MKAAKDLNVILNRIEAAESYRKANFEDRWREDYRLYRSKAQKVEGRSNIFVPYTLSLIHI